MGLLLPASVTSDSRAPDLFQPGIAGVIGVPPRGRKGRLYTYSIPRHTCSGAVNHQIQANLEEVLG